MTEHDIIVIGTSAGGVEVLAQLARGLPKGLPAAIFVVCHFPANARSLLPEILSRAGPLLATHARDGEPTYPGHIYVAPPDRHMLLEPGHVRLVGGARENHHRPAIDPLFRSAARTYGKRVIGVVLTGSLYDGVAGLLAIRGAGGIAVVQDPQDALVEMMPRSARDIAGADHVVAAAGLAPLLVDLVRRPGAPESKSQKSEVNTPKAARGLPADLAPLTPEEGGMPMTDPLEKMPAIMANDMDAQANGARRGNVSVFTCPECGGSLWQVDEKDLVRFRCHVGHAYYAEALLAEQSDALEAALWTAVRTFKEKMVLSLQLAATERLRGNEAAAARFEEQARVSERYSALIQQYLLNGEEAPSSASGPVVGGG